tara:strand:+ start:4897 stop:5148 length:252 start_codon:yes stop_codon:yes gene_type:complete
MTEEKEESKAKQVYKVQIFVSHGYYEYEVDSAERACAHAQAIMATGVYRRDVNGTEVEFHKAYKVKIKGDNIGSSYQDKFMRT